MITKNDTVGFDNDIDELLYKTAAGDKEALGDLYTKTREAVYGFVLSIVRNVHTAEDVMQETYIKIYTSAPAYISQKKPMAWVLTISRNLALMKLREKTVQDFSPEFDMRDESGESSFQRSLDRHVLNTALSILSEEERQIIILHDVSGMKHRETAKILELPLATVLSKYQRALLKLRKHLKELV